MMSGSRKTEQPPFPDLDYAFEAPVVLAVLGALAALFVLSLVL